jgi:hypothetical protein
MRTGTFYFRVLSRAQNYDGRGLRADRRRLIFSWTNFVMLFTKTLIGTGELSISSEMQRAHMLSIRVSTNWTRIWQPSRSMAESYFCITAGQISRLRRGRALLSINQ